MAGMSAPAPRSRTPSRPRSPRSTTRRSAGRSPTWAWSRSVDGRRRRRGPGRDPAHRRRLPAAGQADAPTSPPPSRAVAGRHRRRDRLRRDDRRAAPGPADERCAAAARGRAGHPVRPARLADPGVRGGQRQGRRRQVQRHGEPGRGAGRPRACRSAWSTPTSTATRCPGCSAPTAGPTQVEDMIMPPQAHGVKVISIGMFTAGQRRGGLARPDAAPGAAAVPRRRLLGRPGRAAARPAAGHRRRGDLAGPAAAQRRDPGRDHAAAAAAEVAERAGAIALQTHQRLVGVVENMSWLELPDGDADGGLRRRRRRRPSPTSLTRTHRRRGAAARPDPARHPGPRGRRRRHADRARRPGRPGRARRCSAVADRLAVRRESLVGKPLGLTPAGR